ncbi:hypothetical protein SEA_NATHANVAAG_44 [Arthrobacter phage NathanVaag]|nr:hypothetical protein SEA_NATHANVAAG_44 [Arthrobacter phage NathanVaag]
MKRHYVDEVVAADPSVIHRVSSIYGETYTDKLNHIGAQLGVYRQCAIGYHSQCSQAELRGEDNPCACKCHVDPFHETVIVGRVAIAGSIYTARVQQGEVDLGWLAPGWIEGQDERWITVEPEALPAINALLQQAQAHVERTATGASE